MNQLFLLQDRRLIIRLILKSISRRVFSSHSHIASDASFSLPLSLSPPRFSIYLLGFCAAKDESPRRRINERRLAPRHYLWHRERRVRGRARTFILGPRNPLCESERSLSLSLSHAVRHSLLHFSSRAAPLAVPRACNFFVYENRYFTANHQHFGGVEKTFVIHRVSPRVMRAADRTEPCIEALRRSERVEPSSISIVPFRRVGEKSIDCPSSNTGIVCNCCARW